ncbi:phosphotransferase enzyme family protein [Gryllotalpicola protaetiae]|uniref:Aminoglycoside phosphotransferase n=1 Tax=Gryllotalpicola protaetiae TaxID=2419771 RepID=A0A387C4H6_9MICO|nr:phosphotransferase [Gryllotalpicola protaetiae]AYG05491.1 aminoglycoside phosphotransferase [Gryllotalpicola protaetiae]
MAEPNATAVKMLWEADSPHEVLESRFGFANPGAASRWVIDALNDNWGIRADACERIVMSGRNALAWVSSESGPLLLKWSVAPERFARLAAVAQLTNGLASRGIPVSALVPALDGEIQLELGGASLGLQRKAPGELLDVDDPEQVFAAGAALARLHESLGSVPADSLPSIEAPTQPLAKRVSDWLASSPGHLPADGRETLQRLIAAAGAEPLPLQLVHGDYRAANILVEGGEISAILDFEEAWLDHRIVELARSSVLLGTLFHDWGPVSGEVRRQYRAGYESVRELTETEAGWWDALVLWISLAMIPAGDDPQGWRDAALAQLARLDESARREP